MKVAVVNTKLDLTAIRFSVALLACCSSCIRGYAAAIYARAPIFLAPLPGCVRPAIASHRFHYAARKEPRQ